MPFYENGEVRIRYEEAGSGFPLLVTPGGGLNSRVSNWPTAVFNAMEAFKNDFHCITMDQRNAVRAERKPYLTQSTKSDHREAPETRPSRLEPPRQVSPGAGLVGAG